MLRTCCRRNILLINRLDQHYIHTYLTKKESPLERCFGQFGRSVDFTGIHGPTADDVIKNSDVSNKTCLITGANSGIGLEMTRCLSAHGCNVLMACRNLYAAKLIAKYLDNGGLQLYELNLTSIKSVQKCAQEIIKNHKKLDIVILNAAVFGLPWTMTKDSLETTFQVNYLCQYMLLLELERILAPDARVVFVSSESHRHVNWSFETQMAPSESAVSLPKEEYTSIRAYNISKLCGISFMHYLSYRWHGTSKVVFCAHPGSFVKTQLCRNWWPYEMLYLSMKPFSKSLSQAASTPIYCATSPELNGLTDAYYKDCQRCDESDLAKDLQLSFRIQDLSHDLLSERIDPLKQLEGVTKEDAYPEQSKDTLDDTGLVANYSG